MLEIILYQYMGKLEQRFYLNSLIIILINEIFLLKKYVVFFLRRTTYGTRLQLIHFLFNIAKADGNVSKSEIEKLLEFTRYLNISRIDFESIKAMFFKSSDSDYKILEIDKNCTNDELKKAYRELAKKHHPDKVQNLGEVYVKAAKEKFSKIQAAYENIKKQRRI